MGFLDELKKLTRPYAEDEEDDFDNYDDDTYEDDYSAEAEAEANPEPVARPTRSAARPSVVRGGGRVVSIAPQQQIYNFMPNAFDEVAAISDQLRNGSAIHLNLENTQKDVRRRIVDFMSGAAYVLDGRVKRVSDFCFIVTPRGMELKGELPQEMEQEGVYL